MLYSDTTTALVSDPDHRILEILGSAPGSYPRHLDLNDARSIINASAFAVAKGMGHTVHVTVRWDHCAEFDARDWMTIQGRLFDKLTRFLRRKSVKVSFAWLREMGRKNGAHTHLLLHLPHKLWGEAKEYLLRVGNFEPHGAGGEAIIFSGGKFGTHTPAMRAGHLRYFLKSADPDCIVRNTGNREMPLPRALGVDDRGERRLPIAGKRVGASYSISETMRANFGWQEIHAIPDLRAYLNPHLPEHSPR